MEAELLSLGSDTDRAVFVRDDFAQFGDRDIVATSRFFWQRGLTSTDELGKTSRLNRPFTLGGLRKDGASANDLDFFTGLSRLFPPPAQNRPDWKRNPVECCMPRLLPEFLADLSHLNDLLGPDQAMVNEVSSQLSDGEMCHPSYIAFPTAQLKDEPWNPALATRERASEGWENRMDGIRPTQQISFQAYTLYLVRFIFSAHMVSSWDPFGGISAQLNSLAVLPNLSAVGNSGAAIAYDISIRKHCATLARHRHSDIDFGRILPEECREIKKQVFFQRPIPASSSSYTDQEKWGGRKGKKGNGPGAGKGQRERPYQKKGESEKTQGRSKQRASLRPRDRSKPRRRSPSRPRRARSRKSARRPQKGYEQKQKKQNSKNDGNDSFAA